MKIAIASDLHLEFADLYIPNLEQADVLVLAGDILIASDLHDHTEPPVPYTENEVKKLGRRQKRAHFFRNFLKNVSSQFKHVVYVAGNHEFYHGRWVGSVNTLRAECSKFNNVYFLEQNIKVIDNVTFVGCTLWTDLNKCDFFTMHSVADLSSDYKFIKNDEHNFSKLRPANTVSRHIRSVEYIKLITDDRKDSDIVVVTHMAPSEKSVHADYLNRSLLNGAYFSDLSNLILDRPQIKYWIHGHMHHINDYMIGDCRVMSNPRGYVGFERKQDSEEPFKLITFNI